MVTRNPILLLAVLLIVYSCRSNDEKPLMDAERLNAKAASRPGLLPLALSAAGSVKERDPKAIEVLPAAQVRREAEGLGAWGDQVRPFVWAGGGVLGRRINVTFDPSGLPTESARYDYESVWIILSLEEPAESPQLGSGERGIHLRLDSPLTAVWSFHGEAAFDDGLMHRELGGRAIYLSVPVPDDPKIAGSQVWMQCIRRDRSGGWAASAVTRVTLGYSAAEIARHQGPPVHNYRFDD